jgi:hypothetical protein
MGHGAPVFTGRINVRNEPGKNGPVALTIGGVKS